MIFETVHHQLLQPDPPVEQLNSILTSEEVAEPIQEKENNQLAVDEQEKEENLVDPNVTNIVNNQFEGLDMHWVFTCFSQLFLLLMY